MHNRPAPRPAQRQFASAAEAHAVAAHLTDVMDGLLKVLDHETALVRAGKLAEASHLAQTKSELAKLYITDTATLKANVPFLKTYQPDLLTALREQHERFQALLQVNLTVLATVHAVSEGIMRGVCSELTRKRAPQVYSASGRQTVPDNRYTQPVAMNRAL
jgi:hypothetical protein